MADYELKFDPNTIQHLGVKMYSTLPPALAELISNAYDADSASVKIEFYEQNGTPDSITVYDTGDGMSSADIQERFLVIGRNRREKDGDKPSKKFHRLPTGKKGLGKLALFGLAKEIVVDTTKDGLRNRFILDWDSLLNADGGVYKPKADLINQEIERPNGTVIQLRKLKRKTQFDIETIADSLSRIFIVDSNFSITLKDTNREKLIYISNDRRYANIEEEFSWTHKDLIALDSDYHEKITLNFITAKTPIPPNSGLRGIAIFSRGKLVNLPEYFSVSASSHFYQYLTGWIQADFIDLLSEDVISTNRQSINWDHPEMANFREFLSKLITNVGGDWRKKRAAKKEKTLEKETGINKEQWFNTLPDNVRQPVETIVKKMGEGDDVSETYAPVLKALHELVPEYPLLHWRHLHIGIRDDVAEYYKNQQYGHAADQGAKLYSQKIRDLTKQDKDGADLANFFSYDKGKQRLPTIQLSELNTVSQENIQQGQGHLTRGLMLGFRNPMSHAPVSKVVPEIISELDCLNILSLVSYLMTRLDNATINQND